VESSEAELPNELVYAIVRTMVGAALADGQMHEREKAVIQERLSESGLSAEQVQQVHKDLLIPASPAELSALVSSAEDKELLYRFGALVVLSDEEVTDLERGWLQEFSSALGLSAGRQSEIDGELFEQSAST
jgi:uncharacterized membrane protein YebE (DUF533 family)